MELNKTGRWFYLLTALWMMLLFGLGSWWLYLVFKLHSTLSELTIPQLGDQGRFLNMIKWEGVFFFVILALLGVFLILIYYRDMKKSRAVQIFFSSLSHELKTPLASMRLQAEVIKDLIEDETHSHEQLSQLTKRLIEDTNSLESELEKSLQLSRIEQNASLTLQSVSLERFLKHYQTKSTIPVELNFDSGSQEILADEMAMKVIFRNLFENTNRHHKNAKKILIQTKKTGPYVELQYDDFGEEFSGETHRLGELFYKYNSKKGSGIGLYLIKSLMKKMQGEFQIQSIDRLQFILKFQSPGNQDEAV